MLSPCVLLSRLLINPRSYAKTTGAVLMNFTPKSALERYTSSGTGCTLLSRRALTTSGYTLTARSLFLLTCILFRYSLFTLGRIVWHATEKTDSMVGQGQLV